MDRRNFLKYLGLGGTALAVAPALAPPALAPAPIPAPITPIYAFEVGFILGKAALANWGPDPTKGKYEYGKPTS